MALPFDDWRQECWDLTEFLLLVAIILGKSQPFQAQVPSSWCGVISKCGTLWMLISVVYGLFTRLSNLFHGMDKNTPVRYTVYCSLIKVAASCGAIQYIPTELDQVSYCVEYLFYCKK